MDYSELNKPSLNWYSAIKKQIKFLGENLEDFILICNDYDLFYNDDPDFEQHGSCNECNFTGYTKKYVYFPLEYDGYEIVGYAPIDPKDKIIMEPQ